MNSLFWHLTYNKWLNERTIISPKCYRPCSTWNIKTNDTMKYGQLHFWSSSDVTKKFGRTGNETLKPQTCQWNVTRVSRPRACPWLSCDYPWAELARKRDCSKSKNVQTVSTTNPPSPPHTHPLKIMCRHKLSFLSHRSLIKNKTQTAGINIVNKCILIINLTFRMLKLACVSVFLDYEQSLSAQG